MNFEEKCHNPYFSGISLAIPISSSAKAINNGSQSYFSGISLAISGKISLFSAITFPGVCDFLPLRGD